MLNLIGLQIGQISDELKSIQVVEKSKNGYFDDIIKRTTRKNVYIADESRQNEYFLLPDPRNMEIGFIDLAWKDKLTTFSKFYNKIFNRIIRIKDSFYNLDFLESDLSTLENSYSKFAANSNGTEIYVLYDRNYMLLCNLHRGIKI
jgi:hypothetical protein